MSGSPPPSAPSHTSQVAHVGRQPIWDLAGQLVGYELLFRSGTAQSADQNGSYATGQVIVRAFAEFGVAELVGERLCFINTTRSFLVGELPLPFGPEQVVLEVLETIEVDDEVVAGVAALVARGYRIALDDYVWGSGHERLLNLAAYVKLDMLATDRATLLAIAEDCRAYPGVRLLAEKVETDEDLAFARQFGCKLFQGYLLGRPQVMSVQTLSPSRLGRVQLMAALLRPDVDITEVVAMVTRDPALSLRLLQVTNSVSTGLRHRVGSVHEAVMMLGTAQVRQWVSLMALSDLFDADEAQIAQAVTRARMCQLVASEVGQPSEQAFTVGLLDRVADLLGMPAARLVDQLPLAADVTRALVDGGGGLGAVLQIIRAYEAGDAGPIQRTGLNPERLARSFLAAVGWSTRTMSGLAVG
jgi:EAL and modified HD-GYP domain-containing signal transduction protein